MSQQTRHDDVPASRCESFPLDEAALELVDLDDDEELVEADAAYCPLTGQDKLTVTIKQHGGGDE